MEGREEGALVPVPVLTTLLLGARRTTVPSSTGSTGSAAALPPSPSPSPCCCCCCCTGEVEVPLLCPMEPTPVEV